MNEARENLTPEEIEEIEAWEHYWDAVDEAESEMAWRELQAESQAPAIDFDENEIPF